MYNFNYKFNLPEIFAICEIILKKKQKIIGFPLSRECCVR